MRVYCSRPLENCLTRHRPNTPKNIARIRNRRSIPAQSQNEGLWTILLFLKRLHKFRSQDRTQNKHRPLTGSLPRVFFNCKHVTKLTYVIAVRHAGGVNTLTKWRLSLMLSALTFNFPNISSRWMVQQNTDIARK